VNSLNLEASFSTRRAQELLGASKISRTTLMGLIRLNFVSPARGPRNEFRFSFQDLLILRTAFQLQQANVPPRKILGALGKLRGDMSRLVPLTGLRITAVGAAVAVREPSGQLRAESGQLLMDFEHAPMVGQVRLLTLHSPPAVATAHSCFCRGQSLEPTDLAAAEAAYRSAIAIDPVHALACLNLIALLVEARRSVEAAALCEMALTRGVVSAHLNFNHAIALEDLGRRAQALESYAKSLALEPTLADAHYNSGVILQAAGDSQGALRHFSACRRLEQSP